ncbi:hypothetical protein EF847_10290 [Actinobacteria bacterium YIM 96077]|uniref:DUF3322 and DUF2220 domain-containing protein n=1 Tax=Phytoactinopolyspora halophila TaxID=1981511 RepID=A0A329QDC4_9ACTN|nr:Wadjet anti-phage system protein JetD domain-containing protein [Phytoactinopolyspora halophila]AYY13030.1 hypothetical protein EF847_10290 [Actinobacteria bacterium YIM 96077]RAW09709.1 hypothetical protein DPM12_20335 [Phytoactinopolyspora halophila]
MTSWTSPADVERRLRRRWSSGQALAAYARGEPWEPLGVGLRGPAAGDLASDLGAVRTWVTSWGGAAKRLGRLEYRRIGGRLVGGNELPAKLWVDSYEQLWSALGTTREAERFAELVGSARTNSPRLVEWMLGHPLKVLELEAEWPLLVATVLWIDEHMDGSQYIRQVDVPGVDTKLIERHRHVLGLLLDAQLDERRIDWERPRTDIAGRYGFKKRPGYARLRTLGPGQRLAGAYTELTVRLDELAAAPPDCSKVYVIENDITYLAFPPVDDGVAVFGGGHAVSVLEQLCWLADRELIYWGDIDTHGFAMLDRLRRSFPRARSMLMDRATLLAHEGQWVEETSPYVASLDQLQPDEADLYRDLVEDALGRSVRLEQERISYSDVERALAQPSAAR